MSAAKNRDGADRPPLAPGLSVAAFGAWYWMKDELVTFLRAQGLPTEGAKPELVARIERLLEGRAPRPRKKVPRVTQRDSDQPLRRATPVVNYKNDAKTRAFFEREIGPEFHFTYHLNQWRLARSRLSYGDLIDEWIAERDRRSDAAYRPRLAAHGEWNLFVRDFFADPENAGRTMKHAARAWNVVKKQPGPRKYRRES